MNELQLSYTQLKKLWWYQSLKNSAANEIKTLDLRVFTVARQLHGSSSRNVHSRRGICYNNHPINIPPDYKFIEEAPFLYKLSVPKSDRHWHWIGWLDEWTTCMKELWKQNWTLSKFLSSSFCFSLKHSATLRSIWKRNRRPLLH